MAFLSKKKRKKGSKAKKGWREVLMANQRALLIAIIAVFAGTAVGMFFAGPGDKRPKSWRGVVTESDRSPRLPKITPLPSAEEALEEMTAKGFTLGEPDGEAPVFSTEYGEAVYEEEVPEEPLRPAEKAGEKDERQQAAVPRLVPLRERVGKSDAPRWLRYAVAAPEPDGRAMIAIVVDDLGLNRRRTERTLALKAPLTLAFLPYAYDLPEQTWKAREAGHEIIVHLPMEPLGETFDPGPVVLRTDLDTRKNLNNLMWNLDRFTGYVGINNHMGSKFTADRRGMKALMKEIKERELLYLDSRTTNKTKGPELARELGVPYAERHVFLDNVVSYDAVRARLEDLEGAARRQGFAIGICHPHDATLDALSGWFNSLDESEFVLVPLSAVVLRRMELSGIAG